MKIHRPGMYEYGPKMYEDGLGMDESKDRNESIESLKLWYHLLGLEINKNWGGKQLHSYVNEL